MILKFDELIMRALKGLNVQCIYVDMCFWILDTKLRVLFTHGKTTYEQET